MRKRIPRSMWIRGRLGNHLGSATFGFVVAALVLTCVFHLTIVDRYIVPGETIIQADVYRGQQPYRQLHYWVSDIARYDYDSSEARHAHLLSGGVNRYSGDLREGYVSTWEALPAEERDHFHNRAHAQGWAVYGLGEGKLFKYELTIVAGALTLFGFGPVWYPRTRRQLIQENQQDFERAERLREVLEGEPDPFKALDAAGGNDLGMWRPTEVQPLPSADIRGRRVVTDPFHGGFVVWLAGENDQVLRLVCPGREALHTLFAKTVEGWFRENGEVLPRHSHVGEVLAAYEFGAAGFDPNQVHTRLMRDMQLPLESRPMLRVSGEMIAYDTAIATELVHADGAHQVVAPAGFFRSLQLTLAAISGGSFSALPLEALVERPALRG